MRADSRRRTLILLLWICFVTRGCFYSAILPLWEGYDEPFHFSFIQYVAAHWSLPQTTTPVSREVQESLRVAPLSWEQRLHAMQGPVLTEDTFWQLPPADRERLEKELRAIPPEWGSQKGAFPLMYEAQQAPLYYWIMALPLRLASGWPLAARVLLVRLLSVLVASLLVPIAWLAAEQFFGSRTSAAGFVAIIVCMPELMIDIARGGNECLAVVVYSLLTLLLIMAAQPAQERKFVRAGLVLGLGLLTKAYFLLAVPAFVLVAGYTAWRERRASGRVVMNAIAGLALALAISIGWYSRNHALTGTWSGEENNVVATRAGLAHALAAAVHVKWIGGITSILVSHIWFGGWSFLKLSRPVYLIFLAGMVLALVGAIRGVIRNRLRSRNLFVAIAIYALFWLGMLYDVLLVYVSTGVSASDGWYMYAVVLAETLLVVFGLYNIAPARYRSAVLPALAGAFATIDLYGVAALLVPYYTGVIAHAPGSDIVHAATSGTLLHMSPGVLLARLAVNKAVWLGPEALFGLGVAYVAATLLCVGVTFTVGAAARASAAGEFG